MGQYQNLMYFFISHLRELNKKKKKKKNSDRVVTSKNSKIVKKVYGFNYIINVAFKYKKKYVFRIFILFCSHFACEKNFGTYYILFYTFFYLQKFPNQICKKYVEKKNFCSYKETKYVYRKDETYPKNHKNPGVKNYFPASHKTTLLSH